MELLSESTGELIGKLGDRYSLGKSAVYKRLEFFAITPSKKSGESFLQTRELQQLDELHDWIGTGNSMTSFDKGEMVTASSAGIEEAAPAIEYTTAETGHQINQLVRVAMEKAAGVLMAENILAAQFKNNPDLLPEDLRSQVRATEEAVAPKSIDPKKYALGLVAKYQAA